MYYGFVLSEKKIGQLWGKKSIAKLQVEIESFFVGGWNV